MTPGQALGPALSGPGTAATPGGLWGVVPMRSCPQMSLYRCLVPFFLLKQPPSAVTSSRKPTLTFLGTEEFPRAVNCSRTTGGSAGCSPDQQDVCPSICSHVPLCSGDKSLLTPAPGQGVVPALPLPGKWEIRLLGCPTFCCCFQNKLKPEFFYANYLIFKYWQPNKNKICEHSTGQTDTSAQRIRIPRKRAESLPRSPPSHDRGQVRSHPASVSPLGA